MPVLPTLGKLTQDDCYEYEVNLSSRLALDTKLWHIISTEQNKTGYLNSRVHSAQQYSIRPQLA